MRRRSGFISAIGLPPDQAWALTAPILVSRPIQGNVRAVHTPTRTRATYPAVINRLRKKSPFTCFEGGLIAAVKADLAGERAVWDEFGGARAESGIHLVIALAGEAYPVRAVAAVEITADRTEDELAASLRLEGDVGGLEHVDEIGVPQLHLGDPPPSEQWVLAGGHQVASSLGRRIRL